MSFCTTGKYAFSAYVGYVGGGIYNSTITVYLGDTIIVPTQKTCKDAANCKLPTNLPDPEEAGYRHIIADIPQPPPSEAVLKVVIYRESNGDPPPFLPDNLFDDVTITKIG